MIKTYSIKASDIKHAWHVIDASDKILGKVAVEAANFLMGKNKQLFSRNMDVGDYFVVVNAEKIRVTGDKLKQKMYYRHLAGEPSVGVAAHTVGDDKNIAAVG